MLGLQDFEERIQQGRDEEVRIYREKRKINMCWN